MKVAQYARRSDADRGGRGSPLAAYACPRGRMRTGFAIWGVCLRARAYNGPNTKTCPRVSALPGELIIEVRIPRVRLHREPLESARTRMPDLLSLESLASQRLCERGRGPG